MERFDKVLSSWTNSYILILALVLGGTAPVWADYATGHAAFQRRDYATALQQWSVASQAGEAVAQYSLGILHASGFGVPQSYQEAARWFQQAAQQGYGEAQYNLGLLYARGQGVPQDYVQAYKWLELAARQEISGAAQGRDAIAARMPAVQRAAAHQQLQQWQPQAAPKPSPAPQTARPYRPKAETSAPPHKSPPAAKPAPDSGAPVTPKGAPMPKGLRVSSAGTGFIVSRQGHMLTNYHVIDECKAVSSKQQGVDYRLSVVARDSKNDLALLQQAEAPNSIATFRSGQYVRPGDGVIAIGFPLRGILASEAQITTGNVSALAGVQNDARFIQITAPVQPGNSGGPLLDQSGNVVGIVAGKLDANLILEKLGDIPQNVNFAIKAAIARQFLEKYKVRYLETQSTTDHKSADVGDKGRQFTYVVECWK
ncbi:MAG: trypsin-like peptidase domain-containing protein [Candidatus Tectomicrobia bacterium]|nr:trypsin-like peptidase domain-containing protein [Candidatus Tectomicrobia bacterium]